MSTSLVWPSKRDAASKSWIWSQPTDMLWIAGGASLLFATIAVPVSFLWAGFGTLALATFLHLGAVINYPHYTATYELIVRERRKQRRGMRWLTNTTPLMLLVTGAAVVWPRQLVIPLVRVYLSWSAYHYAAQHFGIATMYSARNGRPLSGREKLALQVSFVGVAIYMIISLNMLNGRTLVGATPGYDVLSAILPRSIYPLAVTLVLASGAAFVAGNTELRARTGRGFDKTVWLLALTNAVWFVVPNIWLPAAQEPWLGERLAIWVPVAVPFFHCAQYLGVAADRARADRPVRPVAWMATLVALGLLLFEGTIWGLPKVSRLTPSQAVLIMTSMINIHHFVLDGVIWKRGKKSSTHLERLIPSRA